MTYGEFKHLVDTIETKYGIQTGYGWTAIHFLHPDKVAPIDVQNCLETECISYIDENATGGFVGFVIEKGLSDIDLQSGAKKFKQYIPVEMLSSISFVPKMGSTHLHINTVLKEIFNKDLTVTVSFKNQAMQYASAREANGDIKNWVVLTEPALVTIGAYKTSAERDAATNASSSIDITGAGTYYLKAFAYNLSLTTAAATANATVTIGG